jgi:hypothetical protein
MLASMLLALLAAALIGALLFILGLRGKRINDHPTCRDCGFDLENVYPPGITCPECGSGLNRPKAVLNGQRRRRPVLVGLGLLLIITSLVPIGAAGFAAITGQDVNQYKPLGLLLWEARRADAKTGKPIAADLMTRMLSGKLTPAQEDRITDLALARQQDPGLAWDEAWGDLIERAKLDGRLSTDQQQRFLKILLVPRLKARPRVATGDPIPISVESEIRGSSSMQDMVMIWLEGSKLNDKPINRSFVTGDSPFDGAPFFQVPGMPVAQFYASGSKARGFFAGGNEAAVVTFTQPEGANPPHSEAQIDLIVQAVPWNMNGANSFMNIKPSANDPKVRLWKLHVPIELVPTEVGAVTRVAPTDDLKDKLAKQLRPNNAMVYGPTSGSGMNSRWVSMAFHVSDLPVPVAFDVFGQRGERSERLGTITSGQGGNDSNVYAFYGQQEGIRQISANLRGITGDKMDLVLKPRPDLAARTLDLTKVYDGEIVIKDVEIRQVDTNTVVTTTTTSTTDDSDGAKDDQPKSGDVQPKKTQSKEKSWLSKLFWF